MNKIAFSKGTFRNVQKVKMRNDILQAVQSSPQFRKEIARVFQIANRRIQNVEKAGVISPAVQALNKGHITAFSKFNMKGTWQELKTEYAKAVSFLRQPTSTASGTKEYNKHIMKSFGLTQEEFNLMSHSIQGKLSSVSDRDFVERYLMRYKDFTGELEQTAKDISSQLESEAQSLARAIDESMKAEADKIVSDISSILDAFNNYKP